MLKLPIYQVDAFADGPFTGNPAAVVPLDSWIGDEQMQAIAEENSLSETAFFVPEGEGYRIRWFTPVDEVDLCGHATLASAHVLFKELDRPGERIEFESRSGLLKVARNGELLTLDFPAQSPVPVKPGSDVSRALGCQPAEVLAGEDYMAVFTTEQEVAGLSPDFNLLAGLDRRGLIATAPSDRYDFVSRFFAPALGVPEDPVTGSSFTQLAPYWSRRLGKQRLHARQISARGGDVLCEPVGGRVLISGKALTFLRGEIELHSGVRR